MTSGNFEMRLEVAEEDAGQRLDAYVTERLPDTSRSFVQRLIEQGDVTINRELVRSSQRVVTSDIVLVRVPRPESDGDLTPAEIAVPIVYEDGDVMVFDKPAGLVVHPAPGHEHGTLVNVLRWLRPDIITPGDMRPGIVHRIDKDTSGLIVVAKNERARLSLLEQWQRRDVLKEYTALVIGGIHEDTATIEAPISRDPHNRKRMAIREQGRPATTHIHVLRRYSGYTLLNVHIVTGRTHQIRVHGQFIGHPVAGDVTYGGAVRDLPLTRQFLHARHLRFALPGGQPIDVQAELPADLQHVLEVLDARD